MGWNCVELVIMSDEHKVLFVRIDPNLHALLLQISSHDAARASKKASTPRTVERIIREAAVKRQLSPFPQSSETATATAAVPQTPSSEIDRLHRER